MNKRFLSRIRHISGPGGRSGRTERLGSLAAILACLAAPAHAILVKAQPERGAVIDQTCKLAGRVTGSVTLLFFSVLAAIGYRTWWAYCPKRSRNKVESPVTRTAKIG